MLRFDSHPGHGSSGAISFAQVSTLEGKQISTLGTTVSEPILHGATTRRMGAPARHLQRRVLGRAMFKDTSLEALPPLGKMSLGASDNFARAIAVANTAESDSDQEDPETLQVSRALRAKSKVCPIVRSFFFLQFLISILHFAF